MQSHIQDSVESPANEKILHESIRKVTDDIENLRFNTAISQLMILLNTLQKADKVSLSTVQDYLKLLAPRTPHRRGTLGTHWRSPQYPQPRLPIFDESKLGAAEIKVIFQVNGKLRGEGTFPETATKDEILAAAKAHDRVQSFIEGKTIRKEIYVPGKIVNIVAN